MRTNLLSLVQFQRTGVRLASRNAELRKNVENRSRLYFQLFREIVNTNLTHPPLFNVCRQKALVVHSFLMALAAFKIPLSRAWFGKTRRILRPVLFGRLLFFNSAFAFIGVKLWDLFGADSFNLILVGLLGLFFGYRVRYAYSLFNHLG